MEGEKCGPLCQHPGCWYSRTKHPAAVNKDGEYQRYLARLLDRRKRLQSVPREERAASSGGLPTLKVQTLADDSALAEHRHHRANTLPPLKRPATAHVSSSRTLTPPSRSDQSRAHTFAEMVLREEEEEEEDFEIIFSPVLIWKPGRRKRRNKAQNFQATAGEDRVCTCPNNTTTTTTGAVEGGVVGSATVGATQTTKSPLPLRRMDLTVSLPPERTLKNQVERKLTSKRGKGHDRVNTADIESFHYLGDIPPQIVAEILHQLRSESSSNIDDTRSRTPHTPHTLTHIPSSLVYNLSTKQLYKPIRNKNVTPPTVPSPRKPATADTKTKRQKQSSFGSFSRRLAEHPDQVIQRRTILPSSLSDPSVGVDRKNHRKSTHILLELPASPPSLPPASKGRPKAVVHSQASTNLLPRRGSAIRYPFGNPVVPRVIQRAPVTEGTALEATTAESVCTQAAAAAAQPATQTDHLGVPSIDQVLEAPQNSPQTSPRAVNLQLEFSEKRDSKHAHVIRLPRNAQSAHSQGRPFSEESPSPIVAPAITKLTRGGGDAPVDLQLITPTPELKNANEEAVHVGSVQPERTTSNPALSSANISCSTSPDFMLVGAHFAGDNLVLLDSEGQMIHHLTDTESDANVSRSEATMYGLSSETEVQGAPSIEQTSPSREEEEEEGGVGEGTRAPPPTAVQLKRPPPCDTKQTVHCNGGPMTTNDSLKEEDEATDDDDDVIVHASQSFP